MKLASPGRAEARVDLVLYEGLESGIKALQC